MSSPSRRIRVLRVVARLNIGGPAIHVAYLSRPGSAAFESLLVTGRENPGEGSLIDWVRSQGVHPVVMPELMGDASIGVKDLRAIWKLVRLIRQFKPDIVDTHTAKAGFVGRIAAAIAGVPVRVHTFHGHVLHGYYSDAKNAVFRAVERGLARLSTRIIAVSEQVRRDLVVYRVAPAEKIVVVPLGLELHEYLQSGRHRGEFIRELGLPQDALLVGIVGRIYPIKNHALFVDAAARAGVVVPNAYFVVVGDGALRGETEARARSAGLGNRIIFTGWRRDLSRIYADLALLVVSSNNEGTPFAAIEAMASGVPVVATRVGGMPDLICDGVTGLLVSPQDAVTLADAVAALLNDAPRRHSMGTAAQADVIARFDVARLVRETESLYRQALAEAGIVE